MTHRNWAAEYFIGVALRDQGRSDEALPHFYRAVADMTRRDAEVYRAVTDLPEHGDRYRNVGDQRQQCFYQSQPSAACGHGLAGRLVAPDRSHDLRAPPELAVRLQRLRAESVDARGGQVQLMQTGSAPASPQNGHRFSAHGSLPGYPQPLTWPTRSQISIFRPSVRILHSFSSENFCSRRIRRCPRTPRSLSFLRAARELLSKEVVLRRGAHAAGLKLVSKRKLAASLERPAGAKRGPVVVKF